MIKVSKIKEMPHILTTDLKFLFKIQVELFIRKTAIYKTRNTGTRNGMRGMRGTRGMFTRIPGNSHCMLNTRMSMYIHKMC